jgi:ParB family transcriptional regulator, chromosome partitioning protein
MTARQERRVAEESARPRLGRGLAALIGDVGDEIGVIERARGQRRVPVEFLRSNPRNPRKHFDDDELGQLAASIRERGIVQPIIVRPMPNLPDAFEIVAGERRWRAAQSAGLHDVPVVIVEVDDKTSLEFAILENVQRADLNAIEEASAYQRLMSEFNYTQEELAKTLGKSRSHVANTLRLLNLPGQVHDMLVASQITAGHARALLAVSDPISVARRIVDQGMTVREVEDLGQSHQSDFGASKTARPRRTADKDPDTRALEKALQDVLGLTVSIEHKGQGGEVRIQYRTLEQLDGLCRRLNPGS